MIQYHTPQDDYHASQSREEIPEDERSDYDFIWSS